MFEQLKNGLTDGVNLDVCGFQSPPINNANEANNFVGALRLTGYFTDGCDVYVEDEDITKVKIVNESSTNICIKRKI